MIETLRVEKLKNSSAKIYPNLGWSSIDDSATCLEVLNMLVEFKKSTSVKRGYHFKLSYSFIDNLYRQTHCAYSGEPFTNKAPDNITLERIDCSKGYTHDNVVAVKLRYNNVRGCLESGGINQSIVDMESRLAQTKKLTENDLKTITKYQQKISNLTHVKKDLERSIVGSSPKKKENLKNEIAKMEYSINKSLGKIDKCVLEISNRASRIAQQEQSLKDLKKTKVFLEDFKSRNNLTKFKHSKGLSKDASLLDLLKNIFV